MEENKIAYFSNTDFSLYNFRLGLMREMKKRGFRIYACAAKGDYTKELKKEFVFKEFPLKRSIDFLGRDLIYFFRVFSFCRKEKPDICHNFTVKPCIFATLAQNMAGVRQIYCSITGSGYAFKKEGVLKRIVVFLYKKSLKRAKRVIFQNPEDMEEFIALNIVKKEKTKLIRGSGVDTDRFSLKNVDREKKEELEKEINYSKEKITITLISRLLWQKGIKEFVEAAEILKKRRDNLHFLLAGPVDRENPSGIPEKKIREWEERGLVKYLGERKDVREVLSLTDIFVFPSYYREGVPKILLEAGAMGLPLVVADISGCREVVKHGVSGFLVEPKKAADLAEKIEILIRDKNLRENFGRESRKTVEKEFGEERVVKETIKTYNLAE